MRIPLFALVLCFLSLLSHAQYRHEKLIYIDESGEQVKEKNAYRLKQIAEVNDSVWVVNLYKIDGPLVLSAHCTTADGNLFNGLYITYDARGAADTVGYFEHGVRHGRWTLRKDRQYLGQLYYENNKLIWKKDSAQLNQEWLQDSAKGIAAGKPNIFKESSFPGGGQGWLQYLNANLRYPAEAVKKEMQGEVRIGFELSKQGELLNHTIVVLKSISYSLDKESLSVVAQSGQWDPALEFGEKVRSWKIQPVVYRLTR